MSMHVGEGRNGPVADINVTPLIDVMLVLLIITMLVAPLLNDRAVRLPKAEHTQARPETGRQTIVHLTASRELYVDNVAVGANVLIDRLEAALASRTERIVYLKADRDAPYSAVMSLMDQLQAARIEQVGLITEAPLPRPAAGREGL